MELIVGGDDLDAESAERWVYLNRIFDPDKIESFVDRLASRIAGFPIEAVRLAKEAVNGVRAASSRRTCQRKLSVSEIVEDRIWTKINETLSRDRRAN